MLELKQIKKEYPAGDGKVEALRGITLQFRENEFVSILGPSGCGKTTMLNIIGGLDQYTEGDLVINGRSTKNFKDRDWDGYRNHSVGFVFQTYNLIPHQTVLKNVELALTLSGVSKQERRKRAKEALEKVGLGNQLSKRPNQMSGGQMQRVAIARALVNNPDIILADEPTGALDTETSVQVMDLLKEVAKDRLVIMVTHNPDLAEKYSTRIIRMLDGLITDDSNPLGEEEVVKLCEADEKKAVETKKQKKPSMSLFTSFSLSLRNLISKKGRTILTSFAGSIGIIGIALIFAVSQGMTTYINTVQEDTLSSYPLTLESSHIDISTLMLTFMETASSSFTHEKDAIYSKPVVYDMLNAFNNLESTENDLEAFKEYIEDKMADPESEVAQAISGIQYTYDLDMKIYTKNVEGDIVVSDTQELMQEMMAEMMGMDSANMDNMMSMAESSPMMSLMSSSGSGASMNLWQEMLPGEDGKLISELLEKQYDVIYGSWPTEYNEVVLVVDSQNELDDMTLYALGLKTEEEMDAIMESVLNKEDIKVDAKSWSYEEICDMEFRTILPADCYVLDESTGIYSDLRETEAGLRYLYDNGIPLKVSGIIRPSEDAVSAMLTGAIGYTSKLTEYIITEAQDSEVVQAQMDSPEIDIFTGLPFQDNAGKMSDEEKAADFRAHIEDLDLGGQAEAYIRIMSIPSAEQLEQMLSQVMDPMTRADMEATMVQAMVQQMGMSEDDITEYTGSMTDEEITELFAEMIAEQIKMQYAAEVEAQLGMMSVDQLAGALALAMDAYTTEQCAQYYEEILEFSESTYEDNLTSLGRLDLDDPATINLYAATFESKDVIEDAIAEYNEGREELSQIKYTDYIGLMMSSITTIINAITYVLIAFVAISLVVSSIMIGVITLISVQERTKEIGILRAIGASKKNVSSMFTAETVIIGFTSGALGVIVTYILCIPINAVIHALTGIPNLSAYLPVEVALILVVISILLTAFAGIIPSRSAAKKDPVVALRTE
ncbi:MAG: ATP-binding cassette domain-containing protein [Lachnospiraceae bacterium]|nr:ATP-binding cassette domain-containing protein [Lachnospiraceae bacterium]